MKIRSIYARPLVNIEHDGKIFAREVHGYEVGQPFYIFDGARYELSKEDARTLEKVMGRDDDGDDQADPYCMHTP